MSTFFCLKPENFLTATTYGSEKKKTKTAQAEKTLNKLRKAQRLAGERPQRPEEELFSFSAVSSPLSFRLPPDFNNPFQPYRII